MAEVVIERCDSYSAGVVRRAVDKALGTALGNAGDSVNGERVLLKPNLLSAREPDRCITTHPSVVGAVIDYFQDRGATVCVGDSPAGALRGISRVWENTGLLDAACSRGATMVNFDAGGWVLKSVRGRPYAIARAVTDFDRIVSLPKFKTHILTVLTAGIKNMFGCVPGFRKSSLGKRPVLRQGQTPGFHRGKHRLCRPGYDTREHCGHRSPACPHDPGGMRARARRGCHREDNTAGCRARRCKGEGICSSLQLEVLSHTRRSERSLEEARLGETGGQDGRMHRMRRL